MTSRSRTSDARSNTGTGGAADGSPLAGFRAQNGARAEHGNGAPPSDGAPPRLSEGIELIGEYEDSGYKDPPSIARRADGQIIQLPEILFVVAEAIDGRRGYDEIAKITTEASGRGVSPENVEFLIDEKLRPLGVVAAPDGRATVNPTGNPGLATGGTGDVLTGLVGGLLAQGLEPATALWSAAYLHGLAGDIAAEARGRAGLVAGDVAEAIPAAIRRVREAGRG